MTKNDFAITISEKLGLTQKDVTRVIDEFIMESTRALAKGDNITLVGFGTFEVKKRQARMGVNPKTLAPIKIPAKRAVSFRVSSVLSNAVNK